MPKAVAFGWVCGRGAVVLSIVYRRVVDEFFTLWVQGIGFWVWAIGAPPVSGAPPFQLPGMVNSLSAEGGPANRTT